MLNYNHLYYFHTAAAEGSIAHAAHRLGVSQDTISEQVRTLERMKLVAVAAPTLPVSDDWSNVALLHYRPSSAFRWDVEEFLEDRNLRPRIAAESDDSLFLIEAAARGGYVAFVPSTVARDPLAAGRLRPLATLG